VHLVVFITRSLKNNQIMLLKYFFFRQQFESQTHCLADIKYLNVILRQIARVVMKSP